MTMKFVHFFKICTQLYSVPNLIYLICKWEFAKSKCLLYATMLATYTYENMHFQPKTWVRSVEKQANNLPKMSFNIEEVIIEENSR